MRTREPQEVWWLAYGHRWKWSVWLWDLSSYCGIATALAPEHGLHCEALNVPATWVDQKVHLTAFWTNAWSIQLHLGEVETAPLQVTFSDPAVERSALLQQLVQRGLSPWRSRIFNDLKNQFGRPEREDSQNSGHSLGPLESGVHSGHQRDWNTSQQGEEPLKGLMQRWGS